MNFKNKFNNKTKLNDDYFSDDEEDNNQTENTNYNEDYTDDIKYEDGENNEDDEEEIDEETRRIMYEHAVRKYENEKNNDYSIKHNEKEKLLDEKKDEKKDKKNKKLTLVAFNKKIEQDINARRPKRFISKRADDKKSQLGMQNDNGFKRSFNPRNPPFNFIKSNDFVQKPEILNLEEFPTL